MGMHVALLRGINVGGKHLLPMARLRALFEHAGYADVRTYIQSGNVAFKADAAAARRAPQTIAAAIEAEFGFAVPVITRTAAEMAAICRNHPLRGDADEDRALAVGFFADKPTKARVAQLAPDISSPDEFVVRGREVYLRYPNGSARSKLTNAWFDRQLQTICSVRNWATTTKLHALATEA